MNLIKQAVAVAIIATNSMAVEATETKEFSKTYDFDAKGKISIENINGDIKVTGWDRDEISLEYTITADSEKDLERVDVDINASGSHFEVEVDFAKSKGWFSWSSGSGEVDFELKVPMGSTLKSIESVNGDLEIKRVAGSVYADTVNGAIEVVEASGDVTAESVNGNVRLEMERMERGQKIKSDTVNGDIVLYAGEDSSFNLRSETLNGDLSNDFGIEVDEGEYVGADMDGEYNDGGAKLIFDTVNGDIELKKK